MSVGSLDPEPKQEVASSSTSSDLESLVSVVSFTQVEEEENVIVFLTVPTQRNLSFCGLSFRWLHTSHSFLILQHICSTHWSSFSLPVASETRVGRLSVRTHHVTCLFIRQSWVRFYAYACAKAVMYIPRLNAIQDNLLQHMQFRSWLCSRTCTLQGPAVARNSVSSARLTQLKISLIVEPANFPCDSCRRSRRQSRRCGRFNCYGLEGEDMHIAVTLYL